MTTITYTIHKYAGVEGWEKTFTVDAKSETGALLMFMLSKKDKLPKKFDGIGVTILSVNK